MTPKLLPSVGANMITKHVMVIKHIMLIVAVNMMLVKSAYAAVCVSNDMPEADFVWQGTKQHLPSNAKGALFQVSPIRPAHKGDFVTYQEGFFTIFFRDLPQPLIQKYFSIYDAATREHLTPTITKLQYKRHFFKTRGESRYFEYQQTGHDKSHKASDTVIVNKSTGLFRIGAKEGFKAGHTYVIEFLGMPGYWNIEKTKQSYRTRKTLTVTIDEQPFDLASFKKLRFTTKRDAKNKKQNKLFYQYNHQQRQYQDAFYSLITINGNGYVQALKYLPKPQQGCHLTPYLWNKTFNQTGIFDVDNIQNPRMKLQGRIGFFEVEDTVFKTQEIRLKQL